MLNQILHYFQTSAPSYWQAVWQHITISLEALLISVFLGLGLAYFAYQHPQLQKLITSFSQGLRVLPSLGVLFILIPFLGVGHFPALVALVFLGLAPILINTVVGLNQVPASLVETAHAMGMTSRQLTFRVSLPLALPYILTGVKLALVEIIASATLATYIGAGGLGSLIFTGLGLYRYDLLVVGGASVALLSLISMLTLDLIIRWSKRYAT